MRLENLSHLGLHQERDVQRELGKTAAYQPQQRNDFGNGVARNMPGQVRHAQAELVRERFGHRHSVRAERSERSRGAAELHDQDAAHRLVEPFDVSRERGRPYRTLQPEGYRHRLLQMRSPGHRRVAIFGRVLRQPVSERHQVAPQVRKRPAHLEHQRGVENVLSGSAKMDVARGLFAAARPSSLTSARIGTPASRVPSAILSIRRFSTRAAFVIASATGGGIKPSRASARASAASTSSIN